MSSAKYNKLFSLKIFVFEMFILSYLSSLTIARDKRGIHITFFLYLHENICCGYSLEVPRRGTSNEYPQHMFWWGNKKNICNIC